MTDIVHDTTALPDAVVGIAYSAAVAFHGAATALIPADSLLTAVSDPAGGTTLPAGLAINTTTNGSVISGTPTVGAGAGRYQFKVTIQDTAGAVQSGTITMYLHPQGTVYSDVYSSTAGVNDTIALQLAREWTDMGTT